MNKLFDALEDETEQPLGAQIGAALVPVIAELRQSSAAMKQSNQALATMLAKSIADALNAVESRQIVVEGKSNTVRKWEFRIERDKQGLLKTITATAKD